MIKGKALVQTNGCYSQGNTNSSLGDSFPIAANAYDNPSQEQDNSEEVTSRKQSPIKTFDSLHVWCHNSLVSPHSNLNDDKTPQLDPSDSKDQDFGDNNEPPLGPW
jgi:hypothetical protein